MLVQNRNSAGKVARLFIQFSDIGVYQFPDWLEILFFPVKGQGFAHLAIQVGQVCKGGQVAASLKGQTLELGQGRPFPDKLRPFFHAVAGYGDILTPRIPLRTP